MAGRVVVRLTTFAPEAKVHPVGFTMEEKLYQIFLMIWFPALLLASGILYRITAPYGRHGRTGWGPTMESRAGWVILESVAVVAFPLFYLWGNSAIRTVPVVIALLWLIHYTHRSLIYPFRMRNPSKPLPVALVAAGVMFNLANCYLHGRFLNRYGSRYDLAWLMDPRFVFGTVLFFLGFSINIHSDGILRRLREPGKEMYGMPEGGLFRYVSCANYLGEILEWWGWALLTWSLPGLAFALFTVGNLVPRARDHHAWYLKNFPNYPKGRRIVVPHLY
jgi:hypothetical protein